MTSYLNIPPPSFVYGIVLSLIIYPTLLHIISPWLTSSFASPSLQKKIERFDNEKRYQFNSMLPSVVHAFVQIVGVGGVVFYGREGYDDEVSLSAVVFDERTFVPYGLTPLGPTVYMGIFVGYLLADILASPSLRAIGYIFVFHHIAASIVWTYSASYRIMQPLACFLQFNELSTPLLSLRHLMLTAGCTSNNFALTIVNIIFFVTFGMIRVIPLPWIIWNWFYRDFGAVENEVGTSVALVVSAFLVVNVGLQGSWFVKMCRKLVGMISGAKSKEPSKEA